MQLTPPRPTALIAQDLWCWPILSRAKDYGIRVPEDLSILGLSNVYNGGLFSELTTVDEFYREIGRKAISLIAQRLNAGVHPSMITPRTVTIVPTIVIRQTCAPPPESRTGV